MSISSAAVRRLFLSATLLGGLAACGGGGDGDAVPAPRPTALPANLVISAPKGHIAIGEAVTFAQNASDPDGKLTYVWQFGDGSSSVGGMPVHAYARSGLLRVQLTVTNEAGESTTASTTVAIIDTALVKDKSCTTSGGWCWQRPLPQGNLIHDTAYVDTLNGWAVGEAGTLLSTHDAGVTWQARRSGTELALTRVVFVDAQTGWIASTNGQLLKTSDGGATWQAVSIGTAESIQSLGASDARTAWVTMSSWSGPLVTTDGGAHWSRISVPATYSVQRYVPASASVVWAVGYGWDGSPSLMRTADAGASWSEALALPVLEQGMSRSIGDLQVAGSEHAWLVSHESGYPNGGNSYVTRTVYLRTVDGGATWQAFAAPIDNVSISMQFTDANNGIAGAGWGSNAWRRTSDGGATWSPIPTPVPPNGGFLTQLRALAAQVLEFKDSQGQIYLSTDGGIHWAQRSPNGTPMPMLNSVWFFDSREGLAILEEAGAEVTVIEYLKTPPGRDELARLYARAGISPRDGLRKVEEGAKALRDASDDAILDAMAADPILIERPLVETERGVRLGRPPEVVSQVEPPEGRHLHPARLPALSIDLRGGERQRHVRLGMSRVPVEECAHDVSDPGAAKFSLGSWRLACAQRPCARPLPQGPWRPSSVSRWPHPRLASPWRWPGCAPRRPCFP